MRVGSFYGSHRVRQEVYIHIASVLRWIDIEGFMDPLEPPEFGRTFCRGLPSQKSVRPRDPTRKSILPRSSSFAPPRIHDTAQPLARNEAHHHCILHGDAIAHLRFRVPLLANAYAGSHAFEHLDFGHPLRLTEPVPQWAPHTCLRLCIECARRTWPRSGACEIW